MLQQEKCSKLIVHNCKLQATITDNNHKTRHRTLHLILSPSTAVGFVFCTCFYAILIGDTLHTNWGVNSFADVPGVLLSVVVCMHSFPRVPGSARHLSGDAHQLCLGMWCLLPASGTFCVMHQNRASWLITCCLRVQSSDPDPDVKLFKY